MSRRPAVSCPLVSVIAKRADPFVDVTITVATPLFGGGAVSRIGDADVPVRGASVRGHLRFWWRACQAHTITSATELFRREAAIWGQAATGQGGAPSAVDIDIRLLTKPRELTFEHWKDLCPEYVVWPFRETRRDTRNEGIPAATALGNIQFQLRISLASHRQEPAPDVVAQVEAAVWAWVMFGGLGARTRRGCGSLWCNDPRFSLAATGGYAAQLADRTKQAAPGETASDPLPLPCIAGSQVLVGRTPGPAEDDWAAAVRPMMRFRQGPNEGRRPNRGRSFWPEADSIRNLTGVSMGRHAPEDPHLRYFPRADLGLPIQFRFKQDDRPQPDGRDPGPHILELNTESAKRMASPAILKPLMVSATQAVPLVLLLDAPPLADLKWNGGPMPVQLRPTEGGVPYPVANPADIQDDAKAATVRPLHRMNEVNARFAFMELAKRTWAPANGFDEVFL